MTWSDFYLICFFVGVGLSALSLVAGSVHLHLPHLHFHGGHVSTHAGGHAGGSRIDLSWFNFGTLVAFLAWFGGTGYVLLHVYHVWYLVALGVAIFSGLGAGAVMFWFLARFLMGHERQLDPSDYDMIGVLGKLSIPIRAGGTGEMVYSQEGTRRVTGARSEEGDAMPKGCEVMVTRYERGIAYVRRWDDPAGEL